MKNQKTAKYFPIKIKDKTIDKINNHLSNDINIKKNNNKINIKNKIFKDNK
jgi:hypothetical protein